MKYIRHESSIFNLPASVVGAAAYLLVGVGMLVPLVAQFSLLVALALFLLERRSQMARAHCLQATLLQALYNLICMAAAFVISRLVGPAMGMSGEAILSAYAILVWVLAALVVGMALVGISASLRWRSVRLPLAAPIAIWLMKRWPSAIDRTAFLEWDE